MDNTITITRQLVAVEDRLDITAELFEHNFPMRLEPFVYGVTGKLSSDYHGGYWEFYTLDNGGFYMAQDTGRKFQVFCENGFSGELSADALGITACMYAYSHLSFGDDAFAEVCAEQFHWLRDYVMGHAEVRQILRAVD
jgi:hypothetical protein